MCENMAGKVNEPDLTVTEEVSQDEDAHSQNSSSQLSNELEDDNLDYKQPLIAKPT